MFRSLLKSDVLRPRKPTRKDNTLSSTHRHIIALMNTLNCPECLSDTLGLVSKLKQKLGANGVAAEGRPNSTSRLCDRARTTLDHKVIKIIALHELKDISTKLGLALTKRLNLCLKRPDLIIQSNPLPQRLSDLRRVPRTLVVRVVLVLHAFLFVRL